MDCLKICITLFCLFFSASSNADCFEEAANYQHVNQLLLKAIAWKESHNKPDAIHKNDDGSVDIGISQINSIHFSELSEYGIKSDQLYNECTNVYVAAWLLKQKMVKHGNTWAAVGAYHSETPDKREAYANDIKDILSKWDDTK